ncbi:MAG: hypothetical protein IKK21_06960, partial [Clostridia bacterium]|nr:hypothetical protein [Clostridia bacterium]
MKTQQKPLAAMLALVRRNLGSYLGAMIANVMIVLIGFATPALIAETIDSVLGNNPSTLPAFLQEALAKVGGRQFLIDNLWILGVVLVAINVINGVFTYMKGRLTAVASENAA